jgi:UDP-N-acetylmuramate dehydrogenase
VSDFDDRLTARFGDRIERGVPLALRTTFRIGGPAERLLTVSSAPDIAAAVALARQYEVPLHILGGGSNMLVADAGLRGLVLRIHGGDTRLVDEFTARAAAGVTINGLVRWAVNRGIAGLEEWAGTPGTVGGAIYGNAHFRGRLISEVVLSVELMDSNGTITRVPAGELEFRYDHSRLHHTREIVLAADFRVRPGVPAQLREKARESLAFRKETQPIEKASAGCIFQNPDPSVDRVPSDIPCSAGALVDRAGLKNASQGGARVSPRHANFIVNDGGATAADVAGLIERCRREVSTRFGVQLKDEIVRLGFDEGAYGRTEN